MTEPAAAYYEARLAELQRRVADLERRSASLSTWRGITFLVAAGLGLARIAGPLPPVAWAAAGLSFAVFLALVVAHGVVVGRIEATRLRERLAARGKARIAGDLAALPDRGDRFLEPGHAYADDLDVFGASSLFQLLDAAETGAGERTLARWLSGAATLDAIEARQASVKELAGLRAYREELAVDGAAAGAKGRTVEPLLAWAEAASKTKGDEPSLSPGVVGATAALVVVTLCLFAVGRALPGLGAWRYLWLVPLALQNAVLFATRAATAPLLAIASSSEEPFARYVALIRRIEGQPFEAPRLAALRSTLAGASGADASRAIAKLQQVVSFAELQHSGLVHFFANTMLAWDVLCAGALDRWRAASGTRMRPWLDAIAEVEALASLATFSDEHPAYAFPEVDAGDVHFEAEGLGHPLIPEARRVGNDVSLGRGGSALLVTGSNMSGKSTLLRAVGVNAVLALAGAPVCATRLRMAVAEVRTSMRVRDSLEEGVSHFYAELARLKAVVDAADAGRPVLFLLDEVLHGTNSRERQLGAKAVVMHLLTRGAVGAVSSHDLGLAELEHESGGRVRNVHLEEQVAGEKMAFDYRLRSGPVTTGNALRLMRIVGLPVDVAP